MQIQAASIGEAIPRDNFDAVIHNVFDTAANLCLVDKNRLITLLVSDQNELPQGIRITQRTASLQSLTVGLVAACRAGVLRFESSPLTVDLRSAPVWECHISELNVDMKSASSVQSWSRVWQMLNSRQKLSKAEIVADDLFQRNAGSLLSQKISRPVLQLISSTGQFEIEKSIEAAGKMIGLGPGVTPAGDDLLIGFLAGLWSISGKFQGRRSFIHSLGIRLMGVAEQTNLISRTYLYHAVHGQFSSSLTNLAQAIALGSENLQDMADAAMRVGHSSGMDSVTGLLIGLCIRNTELSPA
ncbi:MAG: DUF2877 domain-containing protein [Chloroflexota bacterium]